VMLARSGVSFIRLIDFDYVTLSSLNRHATATLEDVGTAKVKSIERFLSKICRFVEVEVKVELWQKETGGALLAGVDWVIDAIDNIDTKVDLLKYCHDNHIKVLIATRFSMSLDIYQGLFFDGSRCQIRSYPNPNQRYLLHNI